MHLTSVNISVCCHMGSLSNQRRAPRGRGVSGCCSSYLVADVYNRSGDLSPEWAVSPCWVERHWCGGQKNQISLLVPKPLKTWLKTCLNFRDKICPQLPLYSWKAFLFQDCSVFPVKSVRLTSPTPLSPALHTPAWRYPAGTERALFLAFSCPLAACPCSCLSLQAGLSQAFVLRLQAQNPGSGKDSSLKTETSLAQENKGLLNLLFEDTTYSLIDMYALPSWDLSSLPGLMDTGVLEFSLKSSLVQAMLCNRRTGTRNGPAS